MSNELTANSVPGPLAASVGTFSADLQGLLNDLNPPDQGLPWAELTQSVIDALSFPHMRCTPRPRLPRCLLAVHAVHRALAQTDAWNAGGATWRSQVEVRRDFAPGRLPLPLPDAEACWPAGGPHPWAEETWAIAVEVIPKPALAIGRALQLLLAADDGRARGPAPADGTRENARPAGTEASASGQGRYSRLVFCCTPGVRAAAVVARRRVAPYLPAPIDIFTIPESALLQDVPLHDICCPEDLS